MSRKLIVPYLTVTIQSTLAEDLNILTTPPPEGNRILVIVIEVVRLPIGNIVCEL